jgi:malonyl-CoA O-methyltransferase
MDVDWIQRRHASVLELMRSLKALGAHNLNPGRETALTGRRRLAAVTEAYPRTADGAVTATYEVVYGHAWAPADPGPVPVPFFGGPRR